MSEQDDAKARAIEAERPGWQVWRGVGGTGWYARLVRSSPPIVVRGGGPATLRQAISLREAL
jgi:hypothetical protein